jgi:hypothetical protein
VLRERAGTVSKAWRRTSTSCASDVCSSWCRSYHPSDLTFRQRQYDFLAAPSQMTTKEAHGAQRLTRPTIFRAEVYVLASTQSVQVTARVELDALFCRLRSASGEKEGGREEEGFSRHDEGRELAELGVPAGSGSVLVIWYSLQTSSSSSRTTSTWASPGGPMIALFCVSKDS